MLPEVRLLHNSRYVPPWAAYVSPHRPCGTVIVPIAPRLMYQPGTSNGPGPPHHNPACALRASQRFRRDNSRWDSVSALFGSRQRNADLSKRYPWLDGARREGAIAKREC